MQQPIRSEVRWEWISAAWKMFTDQMATWILQIVIFILIPVVIILPLIFLTGALGALSNTVKDGTPPNIRSLGPLLVALPILFFVIVFIVLPLMVFLTSGVWHTAIKQLRTGRISVEDLFSGFPSFWPILGFTLLRVLITIIVQVVLSIPNMILDSVAVGLLLTLVNYAVSFTIAGLLFFVAPLIVDGKQGVIEAITNSIKATQSQWLMYALLSFVTGLLVFVGFIFCCVGGLFTFHFPFTTAVVAYRDVFGLQGIADVGSNYAPPPPPNYGGYDPPPPPPSSWQ